jgi:hypothetical protein
LASVIYNVNIGISAMYEVWILCNESASKFLSVIAFCNGKPFRNALKIRVKRPAVIGKGNLNIISEELTSPTFSECRIYTGL